jgi:D-alanine--poly(phosphoribitol) ligase subunit 1
MNIIDRVDNWGRTAPDRLAHVSGDRSLTYGELVRRSDALAAHLAQSLPDDKSPVVVLGHKEPELLIGFLGAIKAGHPYVPVDTVLPAQRVERIVATSGAKVTLTPESVAALASSAEPAPGRRLEPSDPYYIMFTSGSTGEPKGVVITLGCLNSFLEWMLSEHAFEEGETFLNQVSYSFDVSFMDTHVSLVSGGTVFCIAKDEVNNPKQLYQALARSGVTTWVSTPSFANMCLAERSFAKGMLPRVQRFLFCGEALPPDVATQLLERFPGAEVWNTYGPTEATVATTSIRIDRGILAQYSPLPIGYSMPGSRVLIMDESVHEVPAGDRGEIVIAGPNVSPGYLNRPDLTAKAFFKLDDKPAYHTGDWGYTRNGLLFCDGRMDFQLKLYGHRIELGDVEANLRALPAVRDAVVLPVIKDGHPESLVAFVILSQRPPGTDFEVSNNLRVQLAERIPNYMVPRKLRFVDTFPMTVNGKADRRKLAELLT